MTNRNQICLRREMVDLTVKAKKEQPQKKQKLRNTEYYNLQPVFDELHSKAVNRFNADYHK